MGMQAKWLGVFFALFLAGCAVPLSSGGEEQRADRAPTALSTILPSPDQGEVDWVEVWKSAPYLRGKRPHGYKQGFTDVEILAVAENSKAHQIALAEGGDPNNYWRPILTAVSEGSINRSECTSIRMRLSNMADVEKLGPLPIRGDKAGRDADFRGTIAFEKTGDGFFEAEAPLFDSQVSVVVPNAVMLSESNPDPILRITVPEARELRYLPGSNTGKNYMITTNLRDNNRNAFHTHAPSGAFLVTPIVAAGSCPST